MSCASKRTLAVTQCTDAPLRVVERLFHPLDVLDGYLVTFGTQRHTQINQ